MPNAFVMLRQRPEYRSESFLKGLSRAGYTPHLVSQVQQNHVHASDVVVTWNMSGIRAQARDIADRAGARTLVAENGYVGKDSKGRPYYALAEHGHCGSGRWRVGGAERWQYLDRAIAPWRRTGEHILICGQRGIGEPLMRSPPNFEQMAQKMVRLTSQRPIKVRLHPGRYPVQTTLEEDLEGAWACVVWSSNCASTALLRGVPTFYAAPYIVTMGAAEKLETADLEMPSYPERLETFERLAWAQWSIAELESGEPFRILLSPGMPGFKWYGGWADGRYA